MKKRISFHIDAEKLTELIEYADERGFRKIGDFALFAMFQYIRRNPVKSARERPVPYVTAMLRELAERVKKLEERK